MRPRKRRRGIFFFFPLILLALLAIFGIAMLPIWQIQEVVVNGASLLSAEEVRTLAGIPLAENLFFTSFSHARANLGKITAIKDFSLYRIPPGTILINITERKPIAAVVFAKSSIVIDAEGYIINRNPNLTLNIPNRAELPVVSGIDEKGVLGVDRIDATVSQIISEIILKLSSYLEAKTMQLKLGNVENVSFLLDDILYVKVGNAENIRKKMENFQALLPVIGGKWGQVEYVDVRYPDNPVIKYK